MSTLTTAPTPPHGPALEGRTGLITSLAVLSGRSLRTSFRDLESVLMAVILPVMMMLIFVYVLGGAVTTDAGASAPSRSDYLSYVLPAIALTTAGFGASYTAVVVSNDMTTGLIDRLRTMPFPAVTVLLGHAAASLVRNLLATAVVLVIALAVGFRTSVGPLGIAAALGLIALWIAVITVVFATLGMLAGSAEAASGYGFLLLFLPYLSSGFAPVESMPSWLQGFAAHQPMTPLIDAARTLLTGGTEAGSDILTALAWCAGLLVVAILAAAVLFPRRTAR